MKLEIEATFLEIDKDALRAKLQAAGAKLVQSEVLMRRAVFKLGEHDFARVRDEGNRIVLTYKNHHNDALSGTEEINVEVSDYDDTIAILQACGLVVKSVEDSYRESWELNGVEIDIDTWPWLPTYVEIKGPSEAAVAAVSEQLGFSMQDAIIGSVDEVYKLYYDVTSKNINFDLSEIKFTDAPDWLAAKLRPVPLAPATIVANPKSA